MPVLTRSQARKRKAEEPIEHEATHLEINSQPGPEYHPSYKFHDLANDQELQWSLYGQDFYYDLSTWPYRCWFEPKSIYPYPPIYKFEDLFRKLKLMQLFSYAYRYFNPHKMVNVKVDCILDQGYGHETIKCYNMQLGNSIMDTVILEQDLIKRCYEAVHNINYEEEMHIARKGSMEHYLPGALDHVLRVTFEQA
jgi:hypothetical protein